MYFQNFLDSFKTILGTKYFFKKRRSEGKKTSTCARKKREKKEEGEKVRKGGRKGMQAGRKMIPFPVES